MNDQLALHAEQVRQLCDSKAPTWPAKYEVGGKLTGRLTRLMDALLSQVPAGSRVLDIGCGTGELARALAAAGMRVTGCDISVEMLLQAVRNDADGPVEWVELHTEWQTLPFQPESFDAVVAASLLEYVTDPALVLAQCGRILRPAGILICTVPNVRYPIRWFEWVAAQVVRPSGAHLAAMPSPAVGRYLKYLAISCQRHRFSWWTAVAAQAGLDAAPRAAVRAKNSALCLLTFINQRGTEHR